MSNILQNAMNNYLLNEEITKNGNIYVYHVAKLETIPSIADVGFERYYTANGVGNAYGPGVYTTFDINSSVRNARRGEYGRVILKCKMKSLDGFLIYDKNVAQSIYGANYTLDGQLRTILPNDVYNKLRRFRGRSNKFWNSYGADSVYEMITDNPRLGIPRDHTSNCAHASDWYAGFNPDYDVCINGYVFNGPHDGYVCIVRDFKNLYPVEISYDIEKRKSGNRIDFKPFEEGKHFNEFAKNDIDLVLQLRKLGMLDMFDKYTCKACGGTGEVRNGSYCGKCWGTGKRPCVPDYFIDGFARVKMNGKYNYLYKETFKNGPISPIGFDAASETFSKDGTAMVEIGNDRFMLKMNKKPFGFLVYSADGKYLCNLNDLPNYLDEIGDEVDFDNL